jgi:endonuclease-3
VATAAGLVRLGDTIRVLYPEATPLQWYWCTVVGLDAMTENRESCFITVEYPPDDEWYACQEKISVNDFDLRVECDSVQQPGGGVRGRMSMTNLLLSDSNYLSEDGCRWPLAAQSNGDSADAAAEPPPPSTPRRVIQKTDMQLQILKAWWLARTANGSLEGTFANKAEKHRLADETELPLKNLNYWLWGMRKKFNTGFRNEVTHFNQGSSSKSADEYMHTIDQSIEQKQEHHSLSTVTGASSTTLAEYVPDATDSSHTESSIRIHHRQRHDMLQLSLRARGAVVTEWYVPGSRPRMTSAQKMKQQVQWTSNTKPSRSEVLELNSQLRSAFGPRVFRRAVETAENALVGTVLTQNTSDIISSRAFSNLRLHFPNFTTLLNTPVDEIADTISAGGLHQMKALRIRDILRRVHSDSDASMAPASTSLDFLKALPHKTIHAYLKDFNGIGPKTINCVGLYCLQIADFPVDTHVYRFAVRFGWVPTFEFEVPTSHAEATRQPGGTELPAGWTHYFDESSERTYYHNSTTGQTQWEVPAHVPPIPQAAPLNPCPLSLISTQNCGAKSHEFTALQTPLAHYQTMPMAAQENSPCGDAIPTRNGSDTDDFEDADVLDSQVGVWLTSKADNTNLRQQPLGTENELVHAQIGLATCATINASGSAIEQQSVDRPANDLAPMRDIEDSVPLSAFDAVFNRFSTAQDGTVSAVDIPAIVSEYGYHLSTNDSASLTTQLLDKSRSGKIEYDNFKAWWGTTHAIRAPSELEVNDHLARALKDVDHSTLFELHSNLRTLGMRLCYASNPRCDICPLAKAGCQHGSKVLERRASSNIKRRHSCESSPSNTDTSSIYRFVEPTGWDENHILSTTASVDMFSAAELRAEKSGDSYQLKPASNALCHARGAGDFCQLEIWELLLDEKEMVEHKLAQKRKTNARTPFFREATNWAVIADLLLRYNTDGISKDFPIGIDESVVAIEVSKCIDSIVCELEQRANAPYLFVCTKLHMERSGGGSGAVDADDMDVEAALDGICRVVALRNGNAVEQPCFISGYRVYHWHDLYVRSCCHRDLHIRLTPVSVYQSPQGFDNDSNFERNEVFTSVDEVMLCLTSLRLKRHTM